MDNQIKMNVAEFYPSISTSLPNDENFGEHSNGSEEMIIPNGGSGDHRGIVPKEMIIQSNEEASGDSKEEINDKEAKEIPLPPPSTISYNAQQQNGGGYTFESFMKRFWNLFAKKEGTYAEVKSMFHEMQQFLQEEKRELQDEIICLREVNAHLKTALQEQFDTIADFGKNVSDLQEANAQLTEINHQLEEDKKKLETDVEDMEESLADLRLKINNNEEEDINCSHA